MIRRWTWLWALCCVCLLSACAPETGDTSILVTVDSDFLVPDEIDRVTVESSGMPEGIDDPSADLREKALPRSITLTHAGGLYGPFEIVVSAFQGDALIVQKTLKTSFLPGIHARLAVHLSRGCANVLCGDTLTCNAGTCVPVSEALPSAHATDAGAGQDASVTAADAGGLPKLDAGVTSDGGAKTDASTLDAAVKDASVGSDAGPKDAASAVDARSDGSASDTGVVPIGDGAVSAGATPVCTISKPTANSTVLTGVSLALQGTCSDAESGALVSMIWASSVDGAIAMGASTTGTLRTVGAHNLLLCAPDPRDARIVGCGTVHVNATVQPTARILSIRQGMNEIEPFAAGATITLQGTATGTGATLSWRDSLQGAIGNGSTVMLNAPIIGRHVITLDVTDQYGLTATAMRAILVGPALPGR